LALPTLPEACREVAALSDSHYTAAAHAIAACRWHMSRPAAVMLGVYHAISARTDCAGPEEPRQTGSPSGVAQIRDRAAPRADRALKIDRDARRQTMGRRTGAE